MVLDDQLLHDARAGDTRALNSLLDAHQQGVYRYGLRVCRTTEDAEDALQLTLWAATRAIQSFRGTSSSMIRWMFTIIRRECYRIERRRREMVEADLDPVCARPDPASALEATRLAAVLAHALHDLEPMDREAVLLRDVEGLTAPEAAERLGITVAALKSRLHRARGRLQANVLSQGVDF